MHRVCVCVCVWVCVRVCILHVNSGGLIGIYEYEWALRLFGVFTPYAAFQR